MGDWVGCRAVLLGVGRGDQEDKLFVWGKPWEITEVLSLERTDKISCDGAFGWP